jgi:hypothetical protein
MNFILVWVSKKDNSKECLPTPFAEASLQPVSFADLMI